MLLDKYPSLVDKGDDQKTTPLHYAALNGDFDYVKFFHSKGAKIVLDDNGETPLHLAALNGHLNVVKFLVENGCDLNQQSTSGATPLHLAVVNKQYPVVGYLLSNPKTKKDLRDNQGNTASLIASNNKDTQMLNYFSDEKREYLLKIQILEDRVNILEDQVSKANTLHESDQRSVSKAYKQLKSTEDDFKDLQQKYNELKENNANGIVANQLIDSLKEQLTEAHNKIVDLNSTIRSLNARIENNKEDMMKNLGSAHRSLSNIISLFETTNLAIIDSKNSLEQIKDYMSVRSDEKDDEIMKDNNYN